MKKLLKRNEFYVSVVIVLLIILIQGKSGQFFTSNNLVDLARSCILPGILTLGITIEIIAHSIDVSFPAIAMITMYSVTEVATSAGYTGPVWILFLAAALMGTVLGSINGVLPEAAEGGTGPEQAGQHPEYHKGHTHEIGGEAQQPYLPPDLAQHSCFLPMLHPTQGQQQDQPVYDQVGRQHNEPHLGQDNQQPDGQDDIVQPDLLFHFSSLRFTISSPSHPSP